jgi:hypothetical protein
MQLLESAKQLQAEREGHARTSARFDLLREALEEQQHPQSRPAEQEQPSQPQSDPIGALYDVVSHAREMETDRAYTSMLADVDRQSGGEFGEAYKYAVASRTGELMAHYYPGATPQHIWQAMEQGQIPDEVRRQMIAEERASCVNNPNAPSDIIRFAQNRGWRSRASIKAAQDAQLEQERKAEADDDAWFESVARRKACEPGTPEEALARVLHRREDRSRWYEIRARRQAQSWPGSTTATQRGAW